MCIAIAAATIGIGSSCAFAQDAGALYRFDRSADLPTLRFSGTSEIFSEVFRFENTDSVPMKIISISLVDPESSFSIQPGCDCGGMPMTVVPGDLMGVRITLQANDGNIHYNQIRFTMDNGAAPIIFNIEAQRIQAGVNTSSASGLFTFSTVPNPSFGNISIEVSGAEHADIQIFDQAGKLITSQNNISSWIWNGATSTGTPVSSGNYFIRAAATDADGKMIVSTKNVLIIR